MFYYGMQGGGGSFWMGPAALGVVLILIGILLFVWPAILAYVVAAAFLSAGIGMVASAWRLRERVTYRRMDEDEGMPR
jgi:uncharacterized membrane protein YraQ (UPF0718 family)